jgi:hypothetical protein
MAVLALVLASGGGADAEYLEGQLEASISGTLTEVTSGPNYSQIITTTRFADRGALFRFRIDTDPANGSRNAFQVLDLQTGAVYGMTNGAPYSGPFALVDSPAGEGADTVSAQITDFYSRYQIPYTGRYIIVDPTGRYLQGGATGDATSVALTASFPVENIANELLGTGTFGSITVRSGILAPEPSSLVSVGIAGVMGLGVALRRRRAVRGTGRSA